MFRTIVLLRGINVSGKNKVPMADLRAELSKAGFSGVATYIQSGNIAVDTNLNPSELTSQVEEIVSSSFGVDVPAVSVRQAEIDSLVASAPFPKDCDPATNLVYFPKGTIDVAGVDEMDESRYPGDRITASEKAVYVAYGAGQSGSKLTVDALELAASTKLTGRNLRTALKLSTL